MKAVFRLVRPINILIAGVGVWLGSQLADGSNSIMLFWAVLAPMCLAAAGNAHNDWTDLDKDRINRPDRPLPSGALTPRTALGIAMGTFGVGVFSLLFLMPLHVGLFAGMSLALLLYNLRASRWPLIGNLLVAAVVGTSVLLGGVEAGLNERVWVAAGFAFLVTLARELVKDLEDIPGDRAAGARTLPLVSSPGIAVTTVNLILLLLVAATVFPFIFLDFGGSYLLGMGITCSLLLVAMGHTANDPARSSRLLKVAMIAGILALLVADSPVI